MLTEMNCTRRRPHLPSLLCLAAIGLTGCSEDDAGDAGDDAKYRASIRWTENGIPHILADNQAAAAFGQGWAFAKLNGCILADQINKVRGERALLLGPGEDDAHIRSDFVHRFLDFRGKGIQAWDVQPQDLRDTITGYVAGYNAYVTEHGQDMPCADAPYLQPITPEDLMAHYVELSTLASSRQMHDYIYEAQPPGSPLHRDPSRSLDGLRDRRPGSNGWGIGSEKSAGGGGMLLANPHFPWEGELKLYESHVRVPGELDVYGASLMGVVGVLIGFNENVAWTHTVSDGQRFTFYKLTLDPANPTRYLYDGEYRSMEQTEVSIEVLQDDGSVTTRTRPMYRSHYGPILSVDPFGWSVDLVLCVRDANEFNQVLVQQFFEMNRASSLEELQQAHAEVQGIPWVNTMATSAEGRAWYADTTPTPNLSQAAIDGWQDSNDFVINALKTNDVVGLDGSDSINEWVEAPGARDPGLIPFSEVPQLERTDFIFNANDSHWSTNPDALLTGYSPLHGFEETPRSPRTRMNAMLLTETGEGTASGPDGKFTLDELAAAALSNRGSMAELLRDPVVERCNAGGSIDYEGARVDLTPACEALAGWDLRLDLDSPGALMWREFLGDLDEGSLTDVGVLFAVPFDPADYVNTPRDLAPAADDPNDDRVLQALAAGLGQLQQAGLSPTTTLREAQFTRKGDQKIPIHGGGRKEGTPNLIVYSELKTTLDPSMERPEEITPSTDLTGEGYVVNYGTSFIMVLEFGSDGPAAKAFISYSQSGDPTSEHFADQTRRFSEKDWRDIRWTEDDILADPDLVVEEVSGDDYVPSAQ